MSICVPLYYPTQLHQSKVLTVQWTTNLFQCVALSPLMANTLRQASEPHMTIALSNTSVSYTVPQDSDTYDVVWNWCVTHISGVPVTPADTQRVDHTILQNVVQIIKDQAREIYAAIA